MNCAICKTLHRLYECPMGENILNIMKNMYQNLLTIDIESINRDVDISDIIIEIERKQIYIMSLRLSFTLHELKIVGVGWLCSTAYRWRIDRLTNEIYEWMVRYYSQHQENMTTINNFETHLDIYRTPLEQLTDIDMIVTRLQIATTLSNAVIPINTNIECPICCEEKSLVDYVKLGCSHKFCYTCVTKIIENTTYEISNPLCALCRSEIKSISTTKREIFDHLINFCNNV